MSAMPAGRVDKSRPPKSTVACFHCRSKKIKCNGGNPCPNCLDYGRECVYLPSGRRGAHKTLGEIKIIQERLAQVEARLSTAQVGSTTFQEDTALTPPSNVDDCEMAAPVSPVASQHARIEYQSEERISVQEDTEVPDPEPVPLDLSPISLEPPFMVAETQTQEPQVTAQSSLPSKLPTAVNIPKHSEIPEQADSLHETDVESNYEYHGQPCLKSWCSNSSITWAIRQTGIQEFADMAKGFCFDLKKRIRLDRKFMEQREPEPSREIAWNYCQAYFDDATNSMFQFIDRETLETKLAAHHNEDQPRAEQDNAAWYALRNAVFATGCRKTISEQSNPRASKAQVQSWKYFQNALSVFAELAFNDASILSVQALAVMMIYTEGTGTLEFDHMLCATAVRMAEALGLHESLRPGCMLSQWEIQNRQYLWWTIYCYDVQLSVRLGRPMGIDPESVTCGIPLCSSPGDEHRLQIVRALIRQVQISAMIHKRLCFSAPGIDTASKVISLVEELNRALEQSRNEFPSFVKFETSINPADLPTNVHPLHVYHLLCTYNKNLIHLHSVLSHPGSLSWLGLALDTSPQLQQQRSISANIGADTARLLIQMLAAIAITPHTPKWLVVFTPLVSMLNLFLFVVQYPTLPSVQEDIALIHMAGGHLGRYEYLTGDRTFTLATDLATLLRLTVAKVQNCEQPMSPSMMGLISNRTDLNSTESPRNINHDAFVGADHPFTLDFCFSERPGFDYDSSTTLISNQYSDICIEGFFANMLRR